MTATFSVDLDNSPQFVDLLDVASGYGILGVPITGLLPGDVVNSISVSIIGTGLTTIGATVDQVQRAQGYYAWTSAVSLSAFFTLTAAQIAAIAAATACTYSVTTQVTRSGIAYTREVQGGNIAARTALPTPPLIVATVGITGGPAIGQAATTKQLGATGYDWQGNPVVGVSFLWSTSDPTIATVSQSGLVTFVALGGCTITATSYGVSGSINATTTTYSAGALFYASTPSAIVPLAIGTGLQYLRTNAGATAPEWHTFAASDLSPGTFGGNSGYTFPNGLTVTAGGFTVSGGTSAHQALTATTGLFSSTLTVSSGGIVVTGNSTIAGTLGGVTTLTATTVTATSVGGTLTTAAQPNVTSVGVLVSPHATGLVVDSGGLTVTLGGITVSGGTSAVQALTATTGGFSGAVTAPSFVGAVTGNASTATALATPRAINGVNFDGTGPITVTAAAGTLTGATLNATVTASSLTSVGVLASPHMTTAVIDSGGLTITSGTAALQAVTGTTGSFSSTLSSTGDFAVATNKFTVAAASGNTLVAGTLGVTGAAMFAAVSGTSGTFSGAVSATGGLSSASGLTVSAGGSLLTTVTASGLITGSAGLTISSGTSALQATTTTTLATTGAIGVTSNSVVSFSVGPNGTNNPVWLVDSSTASQAAGLKLTGAVAAGTVALAVGSSGGNASLSIDAKGTGTVAIGGVSTGNVLIGSGVVVTSAGVVTAGTYNGQTISSAANLTGSLTVANGLTVTSGTSALQALTGTTATFSGSVSLTAGAHLLIGASEDGSGNYIQLRGGGLSSDKPIIGASARMGVSIDMGQLVFDGDSLTVGVGGTHSYATGVTPTDAGASYTKTITAVSGRTVGTMTDKAFSEVDILLSLYSRNIVVLWGGVNDLLYPVTPDIVLNRIRSYCISRRRAGWQVIVCTLASLNGQETNRLALNVLLRAHWTEFADGLADLGADANIGPLNAYTNGAYFYSDGIHLIDAGYSIVAGLVQSTVNAVIADTPRPVLGSTVTATGNISSGGAFVGSSFGNASNVDVTLVRNSIAAGLFTSTGVQFAGNITALGGTFIGNALGNAVNTDITIIRNGLTVGTFGASGLSLGGSLTVNANGITVVSGTTAVQALTATTIGASGLSSLATLDLTGAPGMAAASHVRFGGVVRTTIGANGGATGLTALPLGYLDIDVAGTIAQIPYYNRGA